MVRELAKVRGQLGDDYLKLDVSNKSPAADSSEFKVLRSKVEKLFPGEKKLVGKAVFVTKWKGNEAETVEK
ncbi:hypothetical protein HY639_01245 [Candidatus Woesearchaeota archaeon]|nr:hypothetical protein [Candidatus Woesearchaeota archaeon]